MSKISNVTLPVALLVSVLALSACATKPKEVAAEPAAPVAAAPAPEPAPAAVAEQPAPAPVAATEQVAPKPVVKKHKKKVAKAKVAPAPVVAPEPVAAPAPAPAPVVKQEEPAPTPPAVTAPPVQKAEPGFLQKYWLWLLGIVVAAVVGFFMLQKRE